MTANSTLQLHLPDLGERGGAPMSYHTKAVRSWLSDLPLADIEQTAAALSAGLTNVNRQSVAPGDRLAYLDLAEETAGAVATSLRQRVRHHPLPLSSHGETIAHLIRDLHRGLATGYKRALLDGAQAGVMRHLPKRSMLAAVHGAMAYLGELLLDSFQTYRLPETGVWNDLHQLYRFAEEHNLTGNPLTRLHTPYGQDSNIQRLYLRLLLLTLASPYRLRPGELDWVNDSLANWVALCEIRTPPCHESGIGILVIDLDSDEPADQPPPASSQRAERYRILTTTDLLPVLRKELMLVHEQQILPRTSDGGTISPDIYRRLSQAWGTTPQRSFSRSERSHNLDVAIGFNALCRLIEDKKSGVSPQPVMEVVPDELPHTSGEYIVEPKGQDVWSLVYTNTSAVRDQHALPPETHRVDTINESAGGFCIVTRKESQLRARVGEIVGVCGETASGEWEIGVIRWMRDSGDAFMEFGVQMIAPCARAISMRPAKSAADDRHWQSALLLPEVRAVMQPVSLILRASGSIPNEIHWIVQGPEGELPLQLGRLLESTGSYAHFQCTSTNGLFTLLGDCS